MRPTSVSVWLWFCAIALCTPANLIAQESKSSAKPKSDPPTQSRKAEGSTTKKISAPPKKPLKAPKKYQVMFETSKGNFVIDVKRSWAPLGADHFYNLVKTGFYDETRFFRVLPEFVIQWGISGNPKVTRNWRRPIKDDPVVASNLHWYVTYATSGKNTRTAQVFVNMKDNPDLDSRGFAPFGKVSKAGKGREVLMKLYSGYGGKASDKQPEIKRDGNRFLKEAFPKLDYIKRAYVVDPKAMKKKEPVQGSSKK